MFYRLASRVGCEQVTIEGAKPDNAAEICLNSRTCVYEGQKVLVLVTKQVLKQLRINSRMINVAFKALAKEAGLDAGRKAQNTTFHVLRRSSRRAA